MYFACCRLEWVNHELRLVAPHPQTKLRCVTFKYPAITTPPSRLTHSVRHRRNPFAFELSSFACDWLLSWHTTTTPKPGGSGRLFLRRCGRGAAGGSLKADAPGTPCRRLTKAWWLVRLILLCTSERKPGWGAAAALVCVVIASVTLCPTSSTSDYHPPRILASFLYLRRGRPNGYLKYSCLPTKRSMFVRNWTRGWKGLTDTPTKTTRIPSRTTAYNSSTPSWASTLK